jgi:hypothetical protein
MLVSPAELVIDLGKMTNYKLLLIPFYQAPFLKQLEQQ